MAEKQKSITYSGIKSMNKTEYFKLFKKPAVWKKSQAMICVCKHKFSNGKVPLVCIPFRKKNEAAKVFKQEVKKDLSPKFILLAACKIIKQADGKPAIEITPIKGNADIKTSAEALFGKMKLAVKINGQATDKQNDDAAVSEEAVSDDATTNDNNKSASSADQIKNLIKSIGTEMKNNISAKVVPNIKNKKISNQDLDIASKVLDNIHELKDLYGSSDDKIKKALKGNYDTVVGYAPKIEKIVQAISKLLPDNTGGATGATPDQKQEPNQASDDIKAALKTFVENAKKLKSELKKLSEVAANIKSKAVKDQDFETVPIVLDFLDNTMAIYEELDEAAQEKYKNIYAKMTDATEKAGKINDKLMFMDSKDSAMSDKQTKARIDEIDKLKKLFEDLAQE